MRDQRMSVPSAERVIVTPACRRRSGDEHSGILKKDRA